MKNNKNRSLKDKDLNKVLGGTIKPFTNSKGEKKWEVLDRFGNTWAIYNDEKTAREVNNMFRFG